MARTAAELRSGSAYHGASKAVRGTCRCGSNVPWTGCNHKQGDAGNEYASGDKLGLNLPELQEELLETVAAMGKPVAVLLMAGSAIDLPWAEHNPNVKAIVDCWYPGARGGKVIAEMLFGEFSPSGKLPVRFYHGTENLPVWNIRDDYERREDIPAGSSGAGSGTAL